MKKKTSSIKLIPIENYATKFEIGKSIRKEKDSNKAYRILYIRVSGKIVCKNKRRYSYNEYKQRLALLALYSRKVIDLNTMAINSGDKKDYHYLYEETAWPYCLPKGKQKVVAVSGIAIGIRPFITKWRVGFSPVSSLYGKDWHSLLIGVYPTYEEASKALARHFPNFAYWDPDIIEYAKTYLEAIKVQNNKKEEVKEEILKKIKEVQKDRNLKNCSDGTTRKVALGR